MIENNFVDGLQALLNDEEIKELSEEYKENSESDHEIRRKGVTFMEFRRQKTIESNKNSIAGKILLYRK